MLCIELEVKRFDVGKSIHVNIQGRLRGTDFDLRSPVGETCTNFGPRLYIEDIACQFGEVL